jgi:hypothetical protein
MGFTGISATTRFFPTDTSLTPSARGMPPNITRELTVETAGLALPLRLLLAAIRIPLPHAFVQRSRRYSIDAPLLG